MERGHGRRPDGAWGAEERRRGRKLNRVASAETGEGGGKAAAASRSGEATAAAQQPAGAASRWQRSSRGNNTRIHKNFRVICE